MSSNICAVFFFFFKNIWHYDEGLWNCFWFDVLAALVMNKYSRNLLLLLVNVFLKLLPFVSVLDVISFPSFTNGAISLYHHIHLKLNDGKFHYFSGYDNLFSLGSCLVALRCSFSIVSICFFLRGFHDTISSFQVNS